MNEIAARLSAIAARDSALAIFGASHHRYQHRPLSLDEVEAFEQRLGVALPAEYRQFLLTIGSGAGPYYGLFTPEEVLLELRGTGALANGYLPIASHGCGYLSAMVTAGELTGTMWDLDFEGPKGHWLPAHRAPGIIEAGWQSPPLSQLPSGATFLQWYEAWIERCEADLPAVASQSPPKRSASRSLFKWWW